MKQIFIEPLMIPRDFKVKTLLQKYCNQQFEKLQDQINSVEIKYIDHFFTETRSGKDQQKTIDDIQNHGETQSNLF